MKCLRQRSADANMASTTSDEKTILVQTKSGPVRGRQRISCESISFISFQGIPYAKPPIGPLRFKVNTT